MTLFGVRRLDAAFIRLKERRQASALQNIFCWRLPLEPEEEAIAFDDRDPV